MMFVIIITIVIMLSPALRRALVLRLRLIHMHRSRLRPAILLRLRCGMLLLRRRKVLLLRLERPLRLRRCKVLLLRLERPLRLRRCKVLLLRASVVLLRRLSPWLRRVVMFDRRGAMLLGTRRFCSYCRLIDLMLYRKRLMMSRRTRLYWLCKRTHNRVRRCMLHRDALLVADNSTVHR